MKEDLKEVKDNLKLLASDFNGLNLEHHLQNILTTVEEKQLEINNLREKFEKERSNHLAFQHRAETQIQDFGGKLKEKDDKIKILEKKLITVPAKIMHEELQKMKEKKKSDIVFGLEERKWDNKETKQLDEIKKVKSLLKDTGSHANFEVSYRVGKSTESSKCRPLIIIFHTIEEQQQVLRNARNLKGKAQWNRTRITQDLTKRQWIVVGGRGKRRLVKKKI